MKDQTEKDLTPPFWGSRVIQKIGANSLFENIRENVLFQGRWQYTKGSLSDEEYEKMLDREIRPEYSLLKEKIVKENLFEPSIIYGFFQCNSDNKNIIIFEKDSSKEIMSFSFPVEKKSPYRSIPGYILPLSSGKRDVMAFQIVTIGNRINDELKKIYANNSFKRYFLLHGLSVESTEALADICNSRIKKDMNISTGLRYSFGFPSCPDITENVKIYNLLDGKRIGISLTEEGQMVPEQSTSAFIIFNPLAKYFKI